MYVLVDMEWVENLAGGSEVSQIALVRVNERWQTVDSFFSRVQPGKSGGHNWEHIGYTGGRPMDYSVAPGRGKLAKKLKEWIRTDDVLCWWYDTGRESFKRFFGECAGHRQIIIGEYVSSFMLQKGIKDRNPYRLAAYLKVTAPGAAHYAKSDAETMRLVLEAMDLPQDILGKPLPQQTAEENVLPYLAEPYAKRVHAAGCSRIPADAYVMPKSKLNQLIGTGYLPCKCVEKEFRAAVRDRNRDIISRTEYNYLFTRTSNVFHRRDCAAMLAAKDIFGTVRYRKCIEAGLRPCENCKPSEADERRSFKTIRRGKTNPSSLTVDEQRALARHRQAQQERQAYEHSGALESGRKDDLYTLTQPRFAFWAAEGCDTFHLRNCKKVSSLRNLRGFSTFRHAMNAGYRPCRHCRPNPKHDAEISLPIYSKQQTGDSVLRLTDACALAGYAAELQDDVLTIETPVGIWRLQTQNTPYRLEHINLVREAENRTKFHRQPRLFLSLLDVYHYIKRHDDTLAGQERTEDEKCVM